MLTEKQVIEIKEHLEKAQNPLFFFDNDQDGLCSFLLLQRYIRRGKGVPVKSFPDLDANYFRKIGELNADYIFILDKPVVSRDFLDEAEKFNIPVVWIDHHEIQGRIPEFVNYYNPLLNKEKSEEPVTALCYQVTQRKEDLWLAVIGCVYDRFFPDFYSDFKKDYPDLAGNYKKAWDVYYGPGLGKIAHILGAGLKDKTGNVISMLKFLMKVKSPYEILEENNKNYSVYKRFKEIDKRYTKLLEKAIDSAGSEKILFFKYGGDLSISSDLANGLMYKFPEKIIVVGYVSGVKINLSVRGKKIRGFVLDAIEDLEDSTGGGHENAIGARIKKEDWEIFKERFEGLIEEKNI